jgi:tRNA(fMet)-specific endonuclease VapC
MMVADSDLLIDFLRGKDPGRARIKLEISTGRLATTAINAFELLSGARSEHEREKVATLLAALTILPVTEESAARAAEARIHLESQGAGIGMADYLIAGVCLDKGGTLLTRNLAHFERVPNLNIGGRHRG